MDFYKPDRCMRISMEENNRHGIIYSMYKISENINQSILWNIIYNDPFNSKFYPSTLGSNFYKLYYPYYCQKLNVQD